MVLTVLFAVTGAVGAIVLMVEIGAMLRRRRVEREWRKSRADDTQNE
jgi:hypothetical protein